MKQDFLVEIGCEELPPRALKTLGLAFRDGLEAGLREREFVFDNSDWFASPRRLAVRIVGLAQQAPDKEIELLGPPVAAARDKNGKWTKAAEGFARRNGIEAEQLVEVDSPRGARLAFRETRPGERAEDCLQAVVENALDDLPIPRRMRWASRRDEFVRPVHWLIMLYGSDVVDAELFGHKAGRRTRGHRFHCDQWLDIPVPGDYEKILDQQGRVIADFAQRREIIRSQVEAEAKKLKGRLVVDADLLDEVTALVELPVALTGSFDEAFLDLPPEALISSMQEHQRYFHLEDPKGNLLPYFVFVANIESREPAQVIEGNERVIRPRLSDAAFFFNKDREQPLADSVDRLGSIVFQEKLGSLLDKSRRVQRLAGYIAQQIGGDKSLAERAAWLSKADLSSAMVLEFDTMQGIAGAYYAQHDGEPAEVATAIREQYLPRFAGDELPEGPVSCALALADRLDTLVGIFGIGQAPTGSRDPFALRRASLAVLRILVERKLPLDLRDLLEQARANYSALPENDRVVEQVLAYMIERFRAWYEEAGIPVQVFQAVSARNVSVPLDFDARVKAVHLFYQLPEAESLAAANKRVSNILARQAEAPAQQVDDKLLKEAAEKALADAVSQKQELVSPLFARQAYTEGLEALAKIRPQVDSFFDDVMVMVDDTALRSNRLALLSQLRELFLQVADISLLSSAN